MPTSDLTDVVVQFSNQSILYWQKTGDDLYGKPTFADPTSLMVRWEDKQQEMLTPEGRLIHSRGYVLGVDQLAVGSLVFLAITNLGALTDWQALPTWPAIPTVGQGCREVLISKTITDLDGILVGYESYL